MSRVRQKSKKNNLGYDASGTFDGGAFTGGARPPASYLSAEFVALFAEYDETAQRLGRARTALAGYTARDEWAAAEKKAQRLDAKESSEAVREGQQAGSTRHIDELHAAKRQAQADVEALTGAIRLIMADLSELREKAKADDVEKLAKAESDARARLAKSTALVQADAKHLGSLLAYSEWLYDHEPFDDSIGIDIREVWPPVLNMNPDSSQQVPIRLGAIVESLNNL